MTDHILVPRALELATWLYAQAHEWTADEIDDSAALLLKQHDALKAALDALENGPSTEHTFPPGIACTCSQCEFVRARRAAIKQIKEML